MKTTLDTVDLIWNHLNSSSLNQVLTGNIYKKKRPQNSTQEDIVINSLPVSNEQLQQAIVNVNIFVPDVEHSINGSQEKMANWARLKGLAFLAVEDLKDGRSGDYTWDIQQQQDIEDEESGQHFINIRVQFYIANI